MNQLRAAFTQLDGLLRGRFTTPEALQEGHVRVDTRPLLISCLALGLLYGISMGVFSASLTGHWQQVFSSGLKVPSLFLLTLLVTFPSLYVVSALTGSSLAPAQVMRLLLVAVGVTLAVLASLAPVLLFFTLSTSSYPFMKLLNLLMFSVSGCLGLHVLRKALDVLFVVREQMPPAPAPAEGDAELATVLRPHQPRRTTQIPGGRRVFSCWIFVYGVVGAQMSWILRPFIGDPAQPFALFRGRESNIFADILSTLVNL